MSFLFIRKRQAPQVSMNDKLLEAAFKDVGARLVVMKYNGQVHYRADAPAGARWAHNGRHMMDFIWPVGTAPDFARILSLTLTRPGGVSLPCTREECACKGAPWEHMLGNWEARGVKPRLRRIKGMIFAPEEESDDDYFLRRRAHALGM